MTHPFHPLFNQELESVSHRQAWGEQRVYYHDSEGQLRGLPAGWTNLAAEDLAKRMSGGRSLFGVEELLELVRVVERLRGSV